MSYEDFEKLVKRAKEEHVIDFLKGLSGSLQVSMMFFSMLLIAAFAYVLGTAIVFEQIESMRAQIVVTF